MNEAQTLAARILRMFEDKRMNTNEIAKELEMEESDVVFLKQQAMEARQGDE